MASSSPPTRGQQAGASSSLHILQMCDLWIIGIGAEAILLAVTGAEDVVAGALHAQSDGQPDRAHDDWVDREILG